MRRASRVLKSAERGSRPVADTVILDYAQRSAQNSDLTGVKGGRFEIALAEPARLRTDDRSCSTTARWSKWWRRPSR